MPLNRLTADEAAYVVDNSDARVGFVDAEHAALLEEIRPRISGMRRILVFDGTPGADMLQAEPLIVPEAYLYLYFL